MNPIDDLNLICPGAIKPEYSQKDSRFFFRVPLLNKHPHCMHFYVRRQRYLDSLDFRLLSRGDHQHQESGVQLTDHALFQDETDQLGTRQTI